MTHYSSSGVFRPFRRAGRRGAAASAAPRCANGLPPGSPAVTESSQAARDRAPDGEQSELSPRARATRRKLLAAAEQEFAEKGYHGTGVAEIAIRAGLAQGTLYVHFRSKQELFTTLIRHLSQVVRQRAAEALARGKSRLDSERIALVSFLELVREHPGIYRIIQESQFVDKDVFREYYEVFVTGYSASLRRAAQAGELSEGNAELRAWAMLGLAHFLGLRYCLWNDALPSAKEMDEVMEHVANGMGPKRRERLKSKRM